MTVNLNNVLLQFGWWLGASLVIFLILRGPLKDARRLLVRLALLLIMLAILLSLIPNIEFGGPGKGEGPGGKPRGKDGSDIVAPTSDKETSLVVEVCRQLSSNAYEVWLKPSNRSGEASDVQMPKPDGGTHRIVAMNDSPEFRRELVRLLGEVRRSDDLRPTTVRLVLPASLSSVAYVVLEDILISGQCVIVSRNR